MIKPVVLFIIGLVCLIKGGDWFVDGASALARKFNLPELLIGATVVSIGTTLPEVMVSTMSELRFRKSWSPQCRLCPATARSLTETRSAP